jgi:hypothetical protein
MGEAVVGKDCKLYYNTGTHATPTWVEIKDAQDVSLPLEKGKAETSSRRSKWKYFGAGLIEAGIDFDYLHNKGADTVFDALLDSFVNSTVKEFAAMDQAIATSGAQGLRFFGQVFQLNPSQQLEEGTKHSLNIAPSRHEESGALVEPDWYEVP